MAAPYPIRKWPDGAYVAVQFVLNYEEGGENCILHGDAASEAFLSEIVGAQAWPGQRHWNMESIYEYGARAGFWRLWRLFTGAQDPAHHLWRGDGARALARPDRGDEGGGLGDREPRPQMDRVQGFQREPRSAPISRKRSASTQRSPASVRSAGIPGAARSTRRSW